MNTKTARTQGKTVSASLLLLYGQQPEIKSVTSTSSFSDISSSMLFIIPLDALGYVLDVKY
ncbi:hypothetical protein WN48_08877 [Eufriesea mexicana]|uniref:Uncharacterized protein n=1 Tax=Eufriesea mexicana TaxID=516756 RepID=A0A310SRN8_9HYME|nr:hypothetical protein WN48_08877 [Eufriesea mexicana]